VHAKYEQYQRRIELTENRFEGEVYAPDFPDGLEWFNADSPVSLQELRGKIVVLDFWTYC